jgi:hypothetical protein
MRISIGKVRNYELTTPFVAEHPNPSPSFVPGLGARKSLCGFIESILHWNNYFATNLSDDGMSPVFGAEWQIGRIRFCQSSCNRQNMQYIVTVHVVQLQYTQYCMDHTQNHTYLDMSHKCAQLSCGIC